MFHGITHDPRLRRRARRLPLILALMMLAGTLSCTPQERTALSFLDTAEHHTYAGMVLLKQEKYDDAEREFRLAIHINADSAAGHAGLSLIHSHRGDLDQAALSLERAAEHARRDRERLFVHIAGIRFHTANRAQAGWMERVEEEFEKAVAIDPRSPEVHYFMGVARMMNRDYHRAGRHFIRVLDLDDAYIEQADREWMRVRTIIALRPSSALVEEIALVDRLTRAQAAVLFLEELRLEDLYRGLGLYRDDQNPVPAVPDWGAHRHHREIAALVLIGVEGFGLYPDGNYYPDDIVTRLTFARAVYDILVTVRGSVPDPPGIRTDNEAQRAEEAEFPLPHNEELSTVMRRNIMPRDLFTSSRHAPYAPISGFEALRAVKNLRNALISGF